MKVALLGASGNAGSAIARELSDRGHQVTAIARHPEKIPAGEGITATAGDASDGGNLVELIRGHDAVISALHFDVPAESLLAVLKAAGVPRFLVVGGAASLDAGNGTRVIDAPDFQDAWRPAGEAGIAYLNTLRAEREIDWTFFSPAVNFVEGPRTGKYRAGGDQVVRDDAGDSKISFFDYAIAMVDALDQHLHSRARFTAAY